MSPFDRAHTISYSYFNRNYASILYRFRDRPYGELFVEIRQLRPTPSASVAPVGGDPFEFRKGFWHQKSRVPGLPCGAVCVFLCLAILVELRLVMDTHVTQTQGHGI